MAKRKKIQRRRRSLGAAQYEPEYQFPREFDPRLRRVPREATGVWREIQKESLEKEVIDNINMSRNVGAEATNPSLLGKYAAAGEKGEKIVCPAAVQLIGQSAYFYARAEEMRRRLGLTRPRLSSMIANARQEFDRNSDFVKMKCNIMVGD